MSMIDCHVCVASVTKTFVTHMHSEIRITLSSGTQNNSCFKNVAGSFQAKLQPIFFLF